MRQEWRAQEALAIHHQQAVEAEQLRDPIEQALAYFNICEDERYSQRYSEAERAGLTALNLMEQSGATPLQRAALYNTLGQVAQAQGDLTQAHARLQAAVALLRPLNLPTQLARALHNLGNVHVELGQAEAALTSFHEARELLENTTHEIDKVNVALSLGTFHFNRNDIEQAERIFRQADTPTLRDSSLYLQRASIANNLGNVLLVQDRVAEAIATLTGSLRLVRLTGHRLYLAITLSRSV